MTKTQDLSTQLMILAATRYCLSRHSYIVSCCQGWLNDNWELLTDHTKIDVVEDIVRTLMDTESRDIDYQGWLQSARLHWNKLTAKQKLFIKKSLSYKRKPWPL